MRRTPQPAPPHSAIIRDKPGLPAPDRGGSSTTHVRACRPAGNRSTEAATRWIHGRFPGPRARPGAPVQRRAGRTRTSVHRTPVGPTRPGGAPAAETRPAPAVTGPRPARPGVDRAAPATVAARDVRGPPGDLPEHACTGSGPVAVQRPASGIRSGPDPPGGPTCRPPAGPGASAPTTASQPGSSRRPRPVGQPAPPGSPGGRIRQLVPPATTWCERCASRPGPGRWASHRVPQPGYASPAAPPGKLRPPVRGRFRHLVGRSKPTQAGSAARAPRRPSNSRWTARGRTCWKSQPANSPPANGQGAGYPGRAPARSTSTASAPPGTRSAPRVISTSTRLAGQGVPDERDPPRRVPAPTQWPAVRRTSPDFHLEPRADQPRRVQFREGRWWWCRPDPARAHGRVTASLLAVARPDRPFPGPRRLTVGGQLAHRRAR